MVGCTGEYIETEWRVGLFRSSEGANVLYQGSDLSLAETAPERWHVAPAVLDDVRQLSVGLPLYLWRMKVRGVQALPDRTAMSVGGMTGDAISFVGVSSGTVRRLGESQFC